MDCNLQSIIINSIVNSATNLNDTIFKSYYYYYCLIYYVIHFTSSYSNKFLILQNRQFNLIYKINGKLNIAHLPTFSNYLHSYINHNENYHAKSITYVRKKIFESYLRRKFFIFWVMNLESKLKKLIEFSSFSNRNKLYLT